MLDPISMNSWAVYAQAFGQGEVRRHKIGDFPTYDAALTAAAMQVLNDLGIVLSNGQSAKELFEVWRTLGDNVSIVPDNPTTPFSATDLARLLTLRLTLDESRPLVWEVTCTDRLDFSSGFSSPPKQWVFWVKVPTTYEGAIVPLRRATEFLYREMSQSALESEGSRYTLLDLSVRELSDAERQAPAHPVVYVIQGDGSLLKELV